MYCTNTSQVEEVVRHEEIERLVETEIPDFFEKSGILLAVIAILLFVACD
jgi:hypothetical protein